MNKIVSGLLAASLSASFAVAVPAGAAPVFAPPAPSAPSDLQAVDYKPWIKHRAHRRFTRNDGMYWNGHRGYREYRRGYRRHGDFWFPLAAFATGALISGAIINHRSGNAHVQWCYDHYRSYRASDNTYQPYSGPRRQCNSPY
ncbi:BA14K family protein [Mesorhizobium qingshengii]|uniref:Lectin-like protein BA14k n=1 Tax=Mesorhizobium qingshengii TaxID=1165689 RepID=A0A1G5ZUP9_9HYPH|nr:BA14K family protein [Mesorhizobium qingshengii]SDA98521.1 BA14K-like protein [Mesorhizobium qingshengii]